MTVSLYPSPASDLQRCAANDNNQVRASAPGLPVPDIGNLRGLLVDNDALLGPIALRLGSLATIDEILVRMKLVQEAVSIVPADALTLAGYDPKRREIFTSHRLEIVVLPAREIGSAVDTLLDDIFARSGLPAAANLARIERLKALAGQPTIC